MDFQQYLQPTYFIESSQPTIITTAKAITSKAGSREKTLPALFYLVRDEIDYRMQEISRNPEDYRASVILERGTGFCVQKAILLAALARACGIPSRLRLAAIKNHKLPASMARMMGTQVLFPHAYNEFYSGNSWVAAAATFNQNLCRKLGVPSVEFDGRHDALLPSKDLSGHPYIEYLDDYGPSADLPLPLILEKLPVYYGNDYLKWYL